MSTPASRPGSVTTVVVLTWISALVAILGGVLALVLSEESLAEAGIAKSTATTYGWVEIVLGVIIALVALGLSSGNNLSRILVSALMALRATIGVWAMIQLPNGIITGGITILVSLLILFLLWNQKANAFFATN
jgi:multisubunit Na+/H+ antiporter MnhG subunit